MRDTVERLHILNRGGKKKQIQREKHLHTCEKIVEVDDSLSESLHENDESRQYASF